MGSKIYVSALACVGLFVAIQILVPIASALRGTSNVDEFTVEDRHDLRHDYLVRGLADELADYYAEPPEEAPRPAAQALPNLIVDYANMIRNDIILLDNSVETRTRKRGNIKVKKHSNQALSNVPCSCERSNILDDEMNYVNLSEAWGTRLVYPQRIRNLTCDEHKCAKPYQCQKIIYNLTVLKGTVNVSEMLSAGRLYEEMPNELKRKWVPRVVPVVAGCLCTSRYLAD